MATEQPSPVYLLAQVAEIATLHGESTEERPIRSRLFVDILRRAVESFHGTVEETKEGALRAVFSTPEDGVRAASSAQIDFDATQETIHPVFVRMALHCPNAEEAGHPNKNALLNRLSRLLTLAHGEQTLISGAMYAALKGADLEEISWKDLGWHRLSDLVSQEHVYQMLYPGMPHEFHPLRSLTAYDRHNLPWQTTSFIGRETEMHAVQDLLNRSRLITLTGTGGCGKTRLALQVGAEQVTRLHDGVWFVELAPLSEPDRVFQEIAQTLNLREEPERHIEQTILKHLQSLQLLLILDNCEHLLEPCATFCEQVLRFCPQVRLLVTSREPLRIDGEHTYRVPSLPVPEVPEGGDIRMEDWSRFDSIRLFSERARLTGRDFELTAENARTVANVCRQLDGIPLAIELAAARIRSLSVQEINARLQDRFRLLTGGSRAAMPRQQTLRALIDWSYEALVEKERRLFQRLSLFAGGWTLEAAEEICAFEGIDRWEVLDLLTALIDKSLVIVDGQEEDSALPRRYHLLETVRQYALDRLTESGQGAGVRYRHARYFRKWIEQAAGFLEGQEQKIYLERIAQEQENLHQAIEISLQAPDAVMEGQKEEILAFGVFLRRYWEVRGYLREGRGFLDRLLRTVRPKENDLSPTPLFVRALHAAGTLAQNAGEHAIARRFHERGVAAAEALGDLPLRVLCLSELAIVAQETGDVETAILYQKQSIDLNRALGNRDGEAAQLSNLGVSYLSLGKLAEAKASLEAALQIQREQNDIRSIAIALNNLGDIALEEGDFAACLTFQKESLTRTLEIGARRSSAYTLESLATLAAAQGDLERTARLFGAAEALREKLGAPLAPIEQQGYHGKLARIKPADDAPVAMRTAWEEGVQSGRRLSLTEAATFALNVFVP